MLRINQPLPLGPSGRQEAAGGRRSALALLGIVVLAAALVGLVLLRGGGDAPVAAGTAAEPTSAAQADAARELVAALPLRFERNVGQTDPQVRYLARGQGFTLFLTPREAVLSLSKPESATGAARPTGGRDTEGAVVRMSIVGANPRPAIAADKPLAAESNYFIGKERHTGVANYRVVTYSSVYPGIDVTWHGRQGSFEYDFVVAPGADPSKIALDFKGADRIWIDPRGDLLLKTAAGTLRQPKPVVYQDTTRGRRGVAGSYILLGERRVGFRLGAYDHSSALVIDPVIVYSTYAGGTHSGGAQDRAADVAIDSSGNAYIAGITGSADFPTTAGAGQTTFPAGASQVAFVTKIDTSAVGAASLRYSTFLGGTNYEDANAIAVDGSGSAYVTGSTFSSDYPTTNPLPGSTCDPSPAGNNGAAFVTKLNPAGDDQIYSTCLGDPASGATGTGIAVDGSGAAYVTGFTFGGITATAGAVQATSAGATDAFVVKLQPMASDGLAYASYLGGAGDDGGADVAVDGANNVYVTGVAGTGFPTTAGAFQTATAGGGDAFVAKVDTAASGPASLVYSTYLGGSADDPFVEFFPGADPPDAGIDVRDGNAYVIGNTGSADFPTQSALQGSLAGGGQDAFVAKLNTTGSALAYSTYLGGPGFDNGVDIAVDAAGSAHTLAATLGASFPTADPLPGLPCTGSSQFVSKFSPAGSALSYSTCIRGADFTTFEGGIAVDAAGNAYAAGTTVGGGSGSSGPNIDLEIINGFQETRSSARDVFLVKLAPSADGKPHVGSLSPRGGPTSGDTRVTISGEGFTGTTAVSFGGTAAASFTVDSDTEITAVTSARAAGTAYVTVTNSAGSSPTRSTLAAYTYGEGGWKTTASIPTARRTGHAATLLADGRVLVTGGVADCPSAPCPVLSSAQLYDPKTATWATSENMATARNRHTATLLSDGKVLVAGGFTNGAPFTAITSAEIYDPASGTWGPAASMGLSRWGHTATLLSGSSAVCGANCGKVLVAGGSGPMHNPRNTAELYDPGSNAWIPTGLLATTRTHHAASALPNGPAAVCGSLCGRVLVSGGFHSAAAPPAELYDPLVGTWSAPSGGPAGADRTGISSSTLLDGSVVSAGGGCFETTPGVSPDSQRFDPAAGTWAPTGPLLNGRASHASAALPNGKLLVVGGEAICQGSLHAGAEIFDPNIGSNGGYRPAGSMQIERATTSYVGGPTATLLSADPHGFAADSGCGENCGRVLIVGGTASKVAELYTPPPTIAAVTPGGASTAGGTAVTITGAGLNNGLKAVRFGGAAAVTVSADSYGQITAVSPAHAAGTVDVTVVTEGGEATRAGAFTYSAAAVAPPPAPPPPPVYPLPTVASPLTAKLSLARATINRRDRVLDVLAPITSLASGRVNVELHAAGQRFRFTAPVNSADGRIRFRQRIPAAQARMGTGILTIRYNGDADTRPQTVRLRAALQKAQLSLQRPTIANNGRLRASGTVSSRARGVVRVQLELVSGGQTRTHQFLARINNGRWSLNQQLSQTIRNEIATRTGTVHSYTLFTGYLPARMRGEMRSFQVLAAR